MPRSMAPWIVGFNVAHADDSGISPGCARVAVAPLVSRKPSTWAPDPQMRLQRINVSASLELYERDKIMRIDLLARKESQFVDEAFRHIVAKIHSSSRV